MSTTRISLDGEWRLRWCDPGEGEKAGWPASGVAGPDSIPGQVPGMTHLDLFAAGKIPDPLFGRNAEKLEWMEEKDWWYSTTFHLPRESITECVEIAFEGIDCFADIWLNGQPLGVSRNALVPWRADITHQAREGGDLLVVRLDTGLRWALQQDLDRYLSTSEQNRREHARIYLRHSQFSFRWDWAPRLLTAGIWRSVQVESHRRAALRDVCLRSRLGPDNRAGLTVLCEAEVFGEEEVDARFDFRLGDEASSTLRYTLAPGYNLVTHEFILADPILWWPNGLGGPHCYDFACHLIDCKSGGQLGEISFPYGIREVQIAQQPLPGEEGQSFTFLINGTPVFAKGANWVPPDSLPSRVTPERYEALIRQARDANFNMFRVWGGGTYESDAFWEACDRLGIMVWLDFQFSCGMIPEDDPSFLAEVAREANLVIRRLRNHPSLVLWCGNNENQAIYRDGRGRHHRFYGWKTYHEVLPKACAALDPTRGYWPSSPYGGPKHGDCDIGDTHSWQVALWGAGDGLSDYKHYRHDRSKFVSEYGFLAPPVLSSIEQALPDEERHVGSPSWQFHANKFETGIPVGGAPSVFSQVFTKLFRRPSEGMEVTTFLRLSQAWQAEAYRYTLSHFRRRKFLTSGTLFWMYADCWVATSGWTIVDYYLRRKPSYYFVRRAFAPEMLSFAEEEGGLSVWLVNDHRHAVEGRLEYGLGRFSTSETELLGRAGHIVPGNCSHRILPFPLPEFSTDERADHYYWARWFREGTLVSWHKHWLAPWGDVRLEDPEVAWEVSRGPKGDLALEIRAARYAWMVEITPGDEVAPEDNYFDLNPGESRTIRLFGGERATPGVSVRAWNDLLRRE